MVILTSLASKSHWSYVPLVMARLKSAIRDIILFSKSKCLCTEPDFVSHIRHLSRRYISRGSFCILKPNQNVNTCTSSDRITQRKSTTNLLPTSRLFVNDPI